MKPWGHHTLTVVAAALAMKGRARVPAAVRPMDPRSTERLLSLLMQSSLHPLVPGIASQSVSSLFCRSVRRRVPPLQHRSSHSSEHAPRSGYPTANCFYCNAAMQRYPLANLGEACVPDARGVRPASRLRFSLRFVLRLIGV